MGPRPIGRGKVRDASLLPQRHLRFNGAASDRTGKARMIATPLPPGDWLQWGRVRSDAERDRKPTDPRLPRSLQWGRVRSDAERIPTPGAVGVLKSLQWGRVRSDAE